MIYPIIVLSLCFALLMLRIVWQKTHEKGYSWVSSECYVKPHPDPVNKGKANHHMRGGQTHRHRFLRGKLKDPEQCGVPVSGEDFHLADKL